MNKHFADDFVHFLMQVNPSELTDNDPTFLEVGEEDEVIGELPESLKRLEAVRRRFRNLFAKAKRRAHGFLGLHYGTLAKPEVKDSFNERFQAAQAAQEDLQVINNVFFHALTRFVTARTESKQGVVYIRRGWKVVLAPEEDQRQLLTPEPKEEGSPLEPFLTRDVAPLPDGMEPPPHEQEKPDAPPESEDEDDVSRGEE